MLFQLINAFIKAVKFNDVDLNNISRIEHNVGYLWFASGGQTYSVSIQEVDVDLDKPYELEEESE